MCGSVTTKVYVTVSSRSCLLPVYCSISLLECLRTAFAVFLLVLRHPCVREVLGITFGLHLIYVCQLSVVPSLVARLPHSGTRALKLCRRGEPGIFSHVRSGKDRREVDATLIVHGRMRLRTEKGTKVAGNLLHVSSYRASNIIHTER